MSSTITLTQSAEGTRQLPLTAQKPQDVYADFNYYLPPTNGSKEPSTDDLELILGTKDQDTRRLRVLDVRGREDDFTLNANGFRYVHLRSELSDIESDQHLVDVYYPELEAMLKRELPNVSAVHHLGHLLRGAQVKQDFNGPTDDAWNKPYRGQAPAPRVHIDFTRRGVEKILPGELGDELAEAVISSKQRWMVFSLWRPIKTITRDPLGVVDASTVCNGDELVPLPRVYPDGRTTENIVVKANKDPYADSVCRHQWYWMSEQKSDELLMIKIFDSAEAEGGERRSPHASFALTDTELEPVRESIECRVVVVFE